VIHAAGKQALAWCFDQALAIGWPEPIRSPAQERFDAAHFCSAEGIEFGEFDNPDALRLESGIFAAQVRKFVGEVWPRKCFQRG
jgi:hypothetical protein